jgi:DNA-binding beta-propeller fold protein YncE
VTRSRIMKALHKPLTAATLVLLAGLMAACSDQQASEAPVAVLDGVPMFQGDAAWPTLPADFRWGQVIGIFADARGHVWTSSSSQISEWDADGNLVQSWSGRGPDGNWSTIHGLFVDHNDFVWTTARSNHLVNKFTRDGRHVMTIGRFDETGGSNDTELLGNPAEIWVDPVTNEAYIADGYGNRRVVVFDAETGRYLRHWGAYGERPDDEYRRDPASDAPSRQFATVHGIAGSRDGLIYVADRANNRVQVFRQNGEYVMEKILRPRCGPDDQPPVPRCGGSAAFQVAFSHDDAQSYLYVADGGSHVIFVLRRSDLEIVDEFGGPGRGVGQMGRPHELTVDAHGNIYVAEAAGPVVGVDPATGEEIEAGYRSQKFTFSGTRP